jgi:tetratricopeptide (TPR) repeat protein
LWSDSRDSRQSQINTGFNNLTPAAPRPAFGAGLTPGEENNTQAGQIRQWSADAVEYIRQGDYGRAVDVYQRLLQLDPDNLSSLNNLGVVYEKKPEWYPQAQQIWKRVLELSESRNDEKHAARARKHLESLARLM